MRWLVVESQRRIPVVSLLRADGALVDRRFGVDEGSTWPDLVASLLARNGPAAATSLCTLHAAGADMMSRQLTEGLASSFQWSAVHALDEAFCRGVAESFQGVGAKLGDHLHVGFGVNVAGGVLDGRWRGTASTGTWSPYAWSPSPTPWSGETSLTGWIGAEGLRDAALLYGTYVEPTSLSARDQLGHLRSDDPEHRALTDDLIEEVSRVMASTLGGAINLTDCAEIVLHTADSSLFDRVIRAVSRHLVDYSFASLREGLRWHRAQLDDTAPALGAVWLATGRTRERV